MIYQNCGDTGGKHELAKGKASRSEEGVQAEKPSCNPKGVIGANKSSEACRAACQEKPLLYISYPYRKPTQVEEERILRPAGEALLRNSAKWPRNFGRRGAYRNISRREMAQATV